MLYTEELCCDLFCIQSTIQTKRLGNFIDYWRNLCDGTWYFSFVVDSNTYISKLSYLDLEFIMTQSIHIGKIWHPEGGLFGKGDKVSPQGDNFMWFISWNTKKYFLTKYMTSTSKVRIMRFEIYDHARLFSYQGLICIAWLS